jgi:hypothetical protein
MLNENKTNTAQQQTALVTVAEEGKADLHLDGELNLSDYVQDIPSSQKTIREVHEWTNQQTEKQRETTRTQIAMRLVTMFSGTLAATFILTGIAAFNPIADKALIKDFASLAISAQVGLLGTALGYYFGAKDT